MGGVDGGGRRRGHAWEELIEELMGEGTCVGGVDGGGRGWGHVWDELMEEEGDMHGRS